MLAQIAVLIVYVLLIMVVAAHLATIYFRVFFLDQLLRHGRISLGLWVVTLVQVLVMAFAMVLIFERVMLFLFPGAQPSWFWLNARVLIVTSTFIGNFFMQMIDDRRRLAAMLADKALMERMRQAHADKENKSGKQ